MNKSKRVAGYQRWRELLFIHWRIPVDQLQLLVPAGLTIEEFDGSAWLGLVPFAMEGIRPWWSPAVPGISSFLETNVRTYVRHQNGESGVWFFSLDANSRIAVAVARRFWHLNYIHSAMTLGQAKETVSYSGRRTGSIAGSYDIRCNHELSCGLKTADPGTIEHFLLERYTLFSADARGRISSGRVHHPQYQFRSVAELSCRQTLTEAAGIPDSCKSPPDHVAFSPGVDVTVSPMKRVAKL